MSTPQGPNGADRGQPGRTPEDQTEKDTGSTPSNQSQKPADSGAARQKPAGAQPAGTQPAGTQPSAPASPAGDKQASNDAPPAGNDKSPAAGAASPVKGTGPAAKGAGAQNQPGPAQPASKQAAPAAPAEGQSRQGQGQQGQGQAAKQVPSQSQPAKAQSAQSQPTQSQPTQSQPAKAQSAPKQEPEATVANPQQTRPTPSARPGGPTPPWQRGSASQSGAQQTTPQTNLPGRGPGLSKSTDGRGASQRPAAAPSSASSRPVVTGAAATGTTGATSRTSETSSPATKAASKAAVIDGPTRHIERKDLAKDLPDLSSVKHPASSSPTTGETPQVGAAAQASVGPTVIPASDPLRATVQVRRIDPWSMLKISSVISVSLFFVWMIAVGLLYGVLAGMGVWERLNSAFTDIVSDTGGDGLISVGQVFGYATVIGVANTVLLTALATLGAFIYNLCTDLVGGVQATLADPD